jgi:hypothetical protein
MNKFFSHLKTVYTHRKWVREYCFKAGLYWQGLTHDLSKYSPVEFFESVKYYQGNRSPIDACKEDKGYSKAWLHHRGHNKHHREYWTDYYDKGCYSLLMPYKYAAEMVCDFLGAGRAYMGADFNYWVEFEWWANQLKRDICIHPAIAHFVTNVLLKCRGYGNADRVLPHLFEYYEDAINWWRNNFDTSHGKYYNCGSLSYKDMLI